MTPKGGAPDNASSHHEETAKDRDSRSAPEASSRYTPRNPASYYESPKWVPILMFTLFGLGMIVIFLHYVDLVLPGATSNWWLFGGLASILGGIITATQYH